MVFRFLFKDYLQISLNLFLDMSVLSDEQLNINFSRLKNKINNKYLKFKDFSIEAIENYYKSN
jgi:hypothetical protein